MNRTSNIIDSNQLRPSARAGVTLLEVMFAAGIMLIGIAGIAAILPLAGRNALDSYAMTQSSSLGQSAFREIMVREMHYPSAAHPWLEPDDINGIFISQINLSNPTQGICIDPMFWAGQPTRLTQPMLPIYSGLNGSEKAYRRTRFPYYSENFNPTSNPANPQQWPNQPRMLRVTVPDGFNPTIPMQIRAAGRRFSLLDDISNPVDENDNTINGIRGFLTRVALESVDEEDDLVQAATNQQLTWMATLTPNETQSGSLPQYYTLSIVVYNRRDRTYAAPMALGGTFDADALPDAERVAWANWPTAASNPIGGNGFTVPLVASDTVDTSIRPGEWMMLSRSAGPIQVHRWYRVVAATEVVNWPTYPSPDPFGNSINNVWSREVQLIGPDWSFSSSEPTTATLMKQVVSVYERVVPVSRPNR